MVKTKPGFLEELEHHHVCRVAVACAIAAWLLAQIATQVFSFFDIPTGVVRVVVLLVPGFPVAVGSTWVFELTPEGIRRTAPADSPDARPRPHAGDRPPAQRDHRHGAGAGRDVMGW